MARKKNRADDAPEQETNTMSETTEDVQEGATAAPEGHQYIKIQGHFFLAPSPFEDGHACNSAEAEALNSLLGENLRNNFAAQMKRAATEGKDIPGQEEFSAYADTYAFGQKRVRVSHTKDPIGAIERRLAESAVRDRIAALGRKWKDLEKDVQQSYIERAVALGRFRAEAERIYSAKNAASAALEGLFDEAA